jgi:hypothetical protein
MMNYTGDPYRNVIMIVTIVGVALAFIALLVAIVVSHFNTVRRVRHIERILVKQFGKEEDNDFTVLL